MATSTIIPGVYFKETDISQYLLIVSDAIIGVVGAAKAGKFDEITINTSYTNFVNNHGIPEEAFPAMIFCREAFLAGAPLIKFVRVGDGTQALATVNVPYGTGGGHFTINSVWEGSDYNRMEIGITGSGVKRSPTAEHNTFTTTTSGTSNFSATLGILPIVPGTVVIYAVAAPGQMGSVIAAKDDGAGALVWQSSWTGSVHMTTPGTVNYYSGAVSAASLNYGSNSTVDFYITYNYYTSMNVQVKQLFFDSNDNQISATVREVIQNLTLESGKQPFSVEINATSNLITVAAPITGWPQFGNYNLSGGSDGIDALVDADYVGQNVGGILTGLQNFSDPYSVDVNILAIPGISSNAVRDAMGTIANTRRDSICIVDPPAGIYTDQVSDWANGLHHYSNYSDFDNNRCAIYFPWFSTFNAANNDNELTPPSAAAIQAMVRANWYEAPAGPINGFLQNNQGVQFNLNDGDRLICQMNRINPIARIQGHPVIVAGQMTATMENSSLNRIAARVILMRLEKAVVTALYWLLFKGNTPTFQKQVENMCQPVLDNMVSTQKIYYGKMICNKSTNTPDIVNANQAAAACIIELPKFAEVITVNFITAAYGANVDEIIGNIAAYM